MSKFRWVHEDAGATFFVFLFCFVFAHLGHTICVLTNCRRKTIHLLTVKSQRPVAVIQTRDRAVQAWWLVLTSSCGWMLSEGSSEPSFWLSLRHPQAVEDQRGAVAPSLWGF